MCSFLGATLYRLPAEGCFCVTMTLPWVVRVQLLQTAVVMNVAFTQTAKASKHLDAVQQHKLC